MTIAIRDETANAIVLTINNDGQLAFGNGTPINMLTLNGVGIVDDDGRIINGAGSTTVSAVSGSGNCGIEQTVTVTTVSGRVPNVQLDTSYPAAIYTYSPPDPDGTDPGGVTITTSPTVTVHGISPSQGSFEISNNNIADLVLTDPSSPVFDSSLTVAGFAYRWI